MAILQLQIKTVGRAQGRNALASAAYRAGEAIRDERTGKVYDHHRRDDVLHKEILLPSALERTGTVPPWLRDRASLWNAAERAEHRGNSRVAREYMVALPAEIAPEERQVLARKFAREIAERFNVAVDLALHAPRPQGDPRNFHAHLLATTREVTPEGLGAKTGLDRQGTVRAELGEPPARAQFKSLRERWAGLVNETLERAQVAARVDPRSLAEQGIDREPRPHLPMAAVAALRRGDRSVAAERLFERYRLRVAQRQAASERTAVALLAATVSPGKGAVDQALPAARDPVPTPSPAATTAPALAATPAAAEQDSESRRRQAVQDWLALRAAEGRAIDPAGGPVPASAQDLRRQAVESWRRLRAKEGESRAPELPSRQGRALEQDGVAPPPGSGRDFSL